MWRLLQLGLLASSLAGQTARTMTLREAVARASEQSPEVLLARLDEQKAGLAVQVARDPFIPKVGVGSGLAYSNGFPMSIEGSAPSLFQARASGSLYNLPQRYQLARVREEARGVALDTQARRDEVVNRTALLYLDAQHAARALEVAQQQVASVQRVVQAVELRVQEGRELPIEGRRAALDLARARQRVQTLEQNRESAERSLAVVLGFGAGDRVRPASSDPAVPDAPGTEEAAVTLALEDNREIRRLESALVAKGFELKSYKTARYPSVDLVGQYALFAKFNNYEDFFRRFQRHNGQIGVSFQVPLWLGPAPAAQAGQAEGDLARLRLEMARTRNRIALDARLSYQALERAATARDIARQDLEVQREQVSIRLAQLEEGRASLRQVEEARFAEHEKWLAFLDAQYGLERARVDLLRNTGSLSAAFR